MRFIDYCAGAGGASGGIVKKGGVAVAAVESNEIAAATYADHHKKTMLMVGDITVLDPRDVPPHEVAVWCPPCQEFSPASGKSAVKAEGKLMGEVLRFMRATRPKYFMFENVPAVRRWDGFVDWRSQLDRMGYWLSGGVIDASPWVPQERERYVLVGRLGVSAPDLPTPRKRVLTARDIIDFQAGEWQPVSSRCARVRAQIASARKRFGPVFLLSSYGAEARYAGRSIDRPIGTITTVIHWSVIVGDQIRFLLPGEVALAQGFKKGHAFRGCALDQHRQIGNAYPGPMAGAVFDALVQ